MSKTQKFDLTQGNILSKLLMVALPIMAMQFFQMMYTLVDMFLLGRISAYAVAASGSAGMFLWLSFAFILIGSMGAEIGVSQSLGKGDPETAKKYSQNATFIALTLGTIYGIILILFSPLLMSFFRIQEAHVVADGVAYLSILGLCIPFNFMSFSFQGTFNGSGNSRYPFIIKASGFVLNIILSILFIFYLGWGIRGAAAATVVAQLYIFIVFVIIIRYHKIRPFKDYRYRDIFKPDMKIIKQIFKWAIPVTIESMCFTLLTMIISRMIATFGAAAIATVRVGTQIEALSWLIAGGFASALTAFVGQNYGAKSYDRIRKGVRLSAGIMSVYGLIVTFIIFFGARFLFSLFIHEEEIILLGIDYLRIFAFVQLIACIESIAAGAFRGLGKTKPPSIVSVSCNVARVFFAYGLSQTALGLNGIWVGMAIGNFFRGGILAVWFYLHSRKMPASTR